MHVIKVIFCCFLDKAATAAAILDPLLLIIVWNVEDSVTAGFLNDSNSIEFVRFSVCPERIPGLVLILPWQKRNEGTENKREKKNRVEQPEAVSHDRSLTCVMISVTIFEFFSSLSLFLSPRLHKVVLMVVKYFVRTHTHERQTIYTRGYSLYFDALAGGTTQHSSIRGHGTILTFSYPISLLT